MGWANAVTGVGGSMDKASNFQFVGGTDLLLSSHLLEEVYEVDDLCSTIVDAVVDEAFRFGWSIQSDLPADLQEATRDFFDRLRVRKQLQKARKWARLFGGAACYIGSDDGNQSKPLGYGGNIHFLHAFEKDELQPAKYYDDPLKPEFGEVSHYRLVPKRTVGPALHYLLIHESRFIIFNGTETTNRKRQQNNSWGSSVLVRPLRVVAQFNGAFGHALALLADANQNVYKIKQFADLLLKGREDVIRERLKVNEEVRSIMNAIAVDADEEDFVRSQLSLSGTDTLLDKFILRLCAAAKMPASKLFGQAPAGLNATGEHDTRTWNAQVGVEQTDELKPALEKFTRVAFRAKNGPTSGKEPGTWSIKFPSLWEPTPREAAEIANIESQTDQTYFDMQVLNGEDIGKARFSAETEGQRPMLTPERIQALAATAGSYQPKVTTEPMPGESDGAGEAPDVETSDDAPGDTAAAALAQKMTDHGIERCAHGYVNRCPRCGIEREQDFEIGDDGQPARDPEGNPKWRILWRPIGAPASALRADTGRAQQVPAP